MNAFFCYSIYVVACVKKNTCLCQITSIMMHLRTQHQPDICADSSGLFTQCAVGSGIVRTCKGTSLWGRSGTQEHTVIFVCQKKKNTSGIMHAYLKMTHRGSCILAHTHSVWQSRCDTWRWREVTPPEGKRWTSEYWCKQQQVNIIIHSVDVGFSTISRAVLTKHSSQKQTAFLWNFVPSR